MYKQNCVHSSLFTKGLKEIYKRSNTMPKRFYVDKNICIGCTLCSSVAPEVFQMEDDGLARVYLNNEMVSDDLIPKADEALETCPVDAIFKVD
jgi:ferredoxin